MGRGWTEKKQSHECVVKRPKTRDTWLTNKKMFTEALQKNNNPRAQVASRSYVWLESQREFANVVLRMVQERPEEAG